MQAIWTKTLDFFKEDLPIFNNIRFVFLVIVALFLKVGARLIRNLDKPYQNQI